MRLAAIVYTQGLVSILRGLLRERFVNFAVIDLLVTKKSSQYQPNTPRAGLGFDPWCSFRGRAHFISRRSVGSAIDQILLLHAHRPISMTAACHSWHGQ